MPAPSLPDELISEILSPALKVSDEVFSDAKGVSPFADPDSESTSAYLLVCKSWLRVATPLLYHVVVIRSKAQAKALGLVLAKNALLGPFIRKLRVEGGYGAPLGTILKCSPNITDLHMTLQVWASDSTSGLCKGLPLISPVRLILQFDRRRHTNQMATNLQDALVKSILKWERLTTVELPHPSNWYQNQWTVVLEALAKAKRLERVKVGSRDLFRAYQLLKACPLKNIHVDDPMSALLSSQLDNEPQLKALVQFAAPLPDPPRANVNPQPVIQSWDFSRNPLISASQEAQESIWTRVMYFAMMSPALPNSRRRFSPSRHSLPLSFLLVSKTFSRLALPYYYAHIRLQNTKSASKFAAFLQQHPAVASQVRTLYGPLRDEEDSHSDSEDREDDERVAAAALLAIFSQTTGLEQVSESLDGKMLQFAVDFTRISHLFMGPEIPWDAFDALATNSGKTLQRFTKPIAPARDVSPVIFTRLTALRVLDWVCAASFVSDPAQVLFDGLPNLATLQLSLANPSFLTALARMNLPLLRTLHWADHKVAMEDLLRAHGSKLTEVVVSCDALDQLDINLFEVCPNLRSITIPVDTLSSMKPLTPKQFSSQKTAACALEKIRFEISYWSSGQKDYIAVWDAAFTQFQPQFPKLREIHVDKCTWPTNERDIAKSCWVRWAETLLKHNISIVDNRGKKWRSRLKV